MQAAGLTQGPLAQVVLDEQWVAKHSFAVGTARVQNPVRLTFHVNTKREDCIRELMKSLEVLPPTVAMTAVFSHRQAPQADFRISPVVVSREPLPWTYRFWMGESQDAALRAKRTLSLN